MSLSSVLYGRLSTYTALTNLVQARIHANKLPQATIYPAVVYQVIDVVPVHSMGTTSGMAQARIQLDVWDESYLSTINVGDQIKAALSRWSDLAADPVVHDTILISRQKSTDDSAGLNLERQMFDFKMIITES